MRRLLLCPRRHRRRCSCCSDRSPRRHCRQCVAPLAREHLDDAAQRVGPVKAGCGATQYLDALDLLQGDRFQRCGAAGRRADAQSIDEHQRLSGVRAAEKHAAGRSRPAIGDDLDTGLTLQQGSESPRASTRDFLRADDRDVGQQVGQRLLGAHRSDDHGRDARLRARKSGMNRAKESDGRAGQRATVGH